MMTDSEKAELAGVYERAAGYLEEHGWVQEMGDDGGPRCFMGGVDSVVGEDYHLYCQAALFAMDALELEGCLDASEIIGAWNDEPGRTEAQVINTLYALANKLR